MCASCALSVASMARARIAATRSPTWMSSRSSRCSGPPRSRVSRAVCSRPSRKSVRLQHHVPLQHPPSRQRARRPARLFRRPQQRLQWLWRPLLLEPQRHLRHHRPLPARRRHRRRTALRDPSRVVLRRRLPLHRAITSTGTRTEPPLLHQQGMVARLRRRPFRRRMRPRMCRSLRTSSRTFRSPPAPPRVPRPRRHRCRLPGPRLCSLRRQWPPRRHRRPCFTPPARRRSGCRCQTPSTRRQCRCPRPSP